jgi:hypothetical protein
MLPLLILLFSILNNAFLGSIGQNRLQAKQCRTGLPIAGFKYCKNRQTNTFVFVFTY